VKARPTRMVLLVISALLLLRADPAAAQIDPVDLAPGDQLYQIQLVDGSLLIARVSAVDADRITLTTSGGTRVEVQRSQIGEVRPAVGQVVDGVFWPDDPNDSRLFFTATGRTLESGTAYAGTYLIVRIASRSPPARRCCSESSSRSTWRPSSRSYAPRT